MAKVNFLFRKAPYGSVNDVEGFRLCTAFAAMEIDTNAIFIDDGVFVAAAGQDPKDIGLPSVESAYKRLVDLNVNLYILEEALKERGITKGDLVNVGFRLINKPELARLLSEANFTIGF